MNRDSSSICIHTMTTKPLALAVACETYAAKGIAGITVWRQHLDGLALDEARRILDNSGLEVVSLCRGGFFPAETAEARQAAIDDNLRAIDEAAAIGAPMVVLVPGAVAGMPLDEGRAQITAGIQAVLPHAEASGVKLAIEPLHPMYADTRSAVNTLAQANDMAEAINHPSVGVALDVYHLWWDPNLELEIARCGERIFAFHICDWRSPTRDLLNDRAVPGEGCIPIARIESWVRAAGFQGLSEVEIFSDELWSGDQHALIDRIIRATQQR